MRDRLSSRLPLMLAELQCTEQSDTDVRWNRVIRGAEQMLPLFREIDLKLSATGASKALGLEGPTALRRVCEDRGLPPFRSLRDWVYVSLLVVRCSGENSIAHWALARGEYPTVYYRFVRAVTAQPWREVESRGAVWVRSCAVRVWSPFLRDGKSDLIE